MSRKSPLQSKNLNDTRDLMTLLTHIVRRHGKHYCSMDSGTLFK